MCWADRSAFEKAGNADFYAKRIKTMLSDREDKAELATWFESLQPYDGIEPILPADNWLQEPKIRSVSRAF
ncbi:hypothetical protein [Salinibius halmophilus]|uniref:hypothetical protein n=1 Tax=Salinibius halmophilus TaxID=1853216 RepID=UPI000E671D78|nr:hypothetical protein [Salinibius halmophilus]